MNIAQALRLRDHYTREAMIDKFERNEVPRNPEDTDAITSFIDAAFTRGNEELSRQLPHIIPEDEAAQLLKQLADIDRPEPRRAR